MNKNKTFYSCIHKLLTITALPACLSISLTLHAQSTQEDPVFCSHLPIVVATLLDKPFPPVNMNDPESSKDKRKVNLKIYDANPGDAANQKLNCLSDSSQTIEATMHYRGASSLGFPKHQFGVKLSTPWKPSREQPTLKTKHFLGMPYGGKSWIFSAEQGNLDGTYLRNTLTFYLFNQFNQLTPVDNKIWSPRTRFFELFIKNPGTDAPDYAGLYVVAEAIEFNDHRIAIKENLPAILYKIDQPTLKNCDIPVKDHSTNETFSVYDYKNVNLVSLDDSDCKKALPDFWPDAFSSWTRSLSTIEQEPSLNIKTDSDSFAISFLINELIKDPDGYNRNTFFYQTFDKNNGDALTMYAGPLWDKNLAYDLKLSIEEFGTTGGYNGYGYPYEGIANWTFKVKYKFWKDVLKQSNVQNKICEYWVKAIHQQILTPNAIIHFIQDKTKWIDQHQPLLTFTPVARDCNRYFPENPSMGNKNCYQVYPLKVDKLIQYINGRVDWMKAQLGQTESECQQNIKKIVAE